MRPFRLWHAGGMCAVAGLLAVAAAHPGSAEAKEKKTEAAAEDEDIDYVQLAARLIKDGHTDRAEATLNEVDLKKEGVDLPRFYTLEGLVRLEQKHYEPARESFRKAIASGQEEKVVFLYLARAHFGLKDYKGVIGALHKAGKAGAGVPGTFLMKSQAHWELEQHAEAFAALDAGHEAFPKVPEFTRIKIFYLIDLGLFQEASRVGEEYLARAEATADDYAAVGEGLRQSKQYGPARDILEAARLRFPDNEKILVMLAHTYLDDDHPLIGAMLFEEAARLNPKYSLEAAELYIRAGRYERALSLNQRVIDQKAKIKQRLSVLIRMERFGMVTGMAPRLSRLGLLDDENIRYALAYAYFKTQQFDQAEDQLKRITDARLFQNAMQLRKAMASCREAGWECT